jgi:hypothetical protein
LTEATAKRPGGVYGEAAGVVPGAVIREERRRFGMANWVLSRQRQASDRAGRTGEPFGEAMDPVLGAEAGRQLGEPHDGPHGNEGPDGGRKTSRGRGPRSEDGFTGKRSAEPG